MELVNRRIIFLCSVAIGCRNIKSGSVLVILPAQPERHRARSPNVGPTVAPITAPNKGHRTLHLSFHRPWHQPRFGTQTTGPVDPSPAMAQHRDPVTWPLAPC